MAIWRDIIKVGLAPLVLTALMVPVAVSAQVTTLNQNTTEKYPTPRDPRYIPPSLPDYLRARLDSAPGAPISPSGEINAETILRAQGVRAATTRRSRYESRGYSSSATTFADRLLFTDSILRQFGIDGLPPRAPEVQVRETESRRFQVVYFLSLPYTVGISYALFTVGTNQLGGRVVFDGPQTVSFISLGLILSGFVAWYDNRRWHDVQADKRLREKKREKAVPVDKTSLLQDNTAGPRAFSFATAPTPTTRTPRDLPVFRMGFRAHF